MADDNDTTPPVALRTVGLCVGPECDRPEDPYNANHLCGTHNRQLTRGRPLTAIEPGFPHPYRGPRIPAEVKALFREMTPMAIAALKAAAEMATDSEATAHDRAVAVKAAETILNRAWGPPPQKVELSLDQIPTEDLEREVKRLEAAVSMATDAAPGADEGDEE